MPIVSGKVKAPISTGDVARALGVNSLDVGTLCSSPKINMWAKYKPVVYPSVKDNGNWAGIKGDYGITTPMRSSIEEAKDSYNGSDNGYIYTRPSGGESSPYRITDFEGYNHSVKCPVSDVSFMSNMENNKRLIFTCLSAMDNPLADYVQLFQIKPLDITYFGIALFKEDGTIYMFKTSGTYLVDGNGGLNVIMEPPLIGSGDATITLEWEIGAYKVIPFLSTVPYSDKIYQGSQFGGYCYTIPHYFPRTLNIVAADTTRGTTLNGKWNTGSTAIIVTVKTSKLECQNVVVWLKLQSSSDYGGLNTSAGETSWVIGDMGLNETRTTSITASHSKLWKLLLYVNGVLVNKVNAIQESITPMLPDIEPTPVEPDPVIPA